MLPTDGHSRILPPLISLQIASHILEVVLGMLLPVVIHNARNIRPGQQLTKASCNHCPAGRLALLSRILYPLFGIRKASATVTTIIYGISLVFPLKYLAVRLMVL
jgi:hypothetical protein